MAFPILSAQEAAELIKNGDNIGLSGFTASGSPKVITEALAAKAVKEHEAGRPFKVSVFTGASTNNHADGRSRVPTPSPAAHPTRILPTCDCASTPTTATTSTCICRSLHRHSGTTHMVSSTGRYSKLQKYSKTAK